MPLLDRFHPPLSTEIDWEAVHGRWATALSDNLNELLPARYYAAAQIHAGARVEIDVATLERSTPLQSATVNGGVATLEPKLWAPPAPALTMPFTFADDYEVQVISTRAGPRLVAAIELISESNKDRPEARRAFAAKCASYLRNGLGLIIVDVVTCLRANLHNEMIDLLKADAAYMLSLKEALYAVAYRPVRRDGREETDLWPTALVVGDALPTLPLWLNWETCLPVDLEAAYVDACRRLRIRQPEGKA